MVRVAVPRKEVPRVEVEVPREEVPVLRVEEVVLRLAEAEAREDVVVAVVREAGVSLLPVERSETVRLEGVVAELLRLEVPVVVALPRLLPLALLRLEVSVVALLRLEAGEVVRVLVEVLVPRVEGVAAGVLVEVPRVVVALLVLREVLLFRLPLSTLGLVEEPWLGATTVGLLLPGVHLPLGMGAGVLGLRI